MSSGFKEVRFSIGLNLGLEFPYGDFCGLGNEVDKDRTSAVLCILELNEQEEKQSLRFLNIALNDTSLFLL